MLRLTEADRPTQRAVTARQVDDLEAFVTEALVNFWTEQEAVVIARLRGQKVRKGTRHWRVPGGLPTVTKAIDPDRVLRPQDVAQAAADYGEGIALHLGTEALGAAKGALGADDLEVGVDSPLVQDAVADAIAAILGVAGEKADLVRDVILRADSTDAELDEILDLVRGTYAQREAWAETFARSQVNAQVNRAGLAAARAAGVVTKEWLSSHDEDVRPTHRIADSQVRGIDAAFQVGAFELDYPADPKDWPASAEEVANCRCSMLFGRPNSLAEPKPWQEGEAPVPDEAELAALFAQLADMGGADGTTIGPRAALSGEPLVGYRVASRGAFTAEIGTEVQAYAATTLTLLRAQAVAAAGAGDWIVEIEVPAAFGLTRAPNSVEVALPQGAVLEVVAVTGDTVRMRLRR